MLLEATDKTVYNQQKGGMNMLSENIRYYRKEKGLSQEELAAKLNVVRQTVSKWEQNLSVPDSEMLIKIAEIFEVPVSKLIGETVKGNETENELKEISKKLENLNAMIAEQNARKTRKNYIIIASFLIAVFVVMLVITLIFIMGFCISVNPSTSVAIIGGADGPTQITVASQITLLEVVISALLAIAALTGSVLIIKKLRK